MMSRVREAWPVRRVSALAYGIWDTFLRDNRVVPPILAVVALFIFAWIVAGSFIGAPDDQTVANRDEIAQSPDPSQSQVVPEVEAPNADSYAAYESKDPFRAIFESPQSETTTDDSSDDLSSTDDGDSGDTTGDDGNSGSGSGGNSGNGGNGNGSTGNGSGGTSGNGSQGGNGSGSGDDDPVREDPTAGQYGDQGDITSGNAGGNGSGGNSSGNNGQNNGGQGTADGLFDSGGNLPSPGDRGGDR